MTKIDDRISQHGIEDLSSILDLVRWSVSRFNEAGLYYGHGTDNAWDEAMSMVLQLLHLPQDLVLQTSEQVLNARLTREEKALLMEMTMRRVNERIPVAYLTHQAWFCGLPFYVDERVLVPRSPFAELINSKFKPWVSKQPNHILDLCTGSGCIAIALAYAFENAQVDAVDISEDALEVADLNINEHGLSQQVFPIKSDVFTSLQGHKYDLIISNPPYVDAEDMDDLPEEFHHEPELGLAAGNDGLDLVDTILREAPLHLNDKGLLFVEVGNSQIHVEQRYPKLALKWIDFELGGHGVFVVDKENLIQYWNKYGNLNK